MRNIRNFLVGGIVPLAITMAALAQGLEPAPFEYCASLGRFNYSGTVSRDGKMLAVGGMHAFLGKEGCRGGWILWEVATGKHLQAAGMKGGNAHCLALSPDGKTLAAGGNNTELRLFDIATGSSLAVLPGHRAGLALVEFTNDGKYLVSEARDNMIGSGAQRIDARWPRTGSRRGTGGLIFGSSYQSSRSSAPR